MKLLFKEKQHENFDIREWEFPKEVINAFGNRHSYTEGKRILNGEVFKNKELISRFELYLANHHIDDYNGLKVFEYPDFKYVQKVNEVGEDYGSENVELYVSDTPIRKLEEWDFENGKRITFNDILKNWSGEKQ